MNMKVLFAGFACFASIALQGCGQEPEKEADKQAADKPAGQQGGAPAKQLSKQKSLQGEEGSASCADGDFKCSKGSKQWCTEQLRKCNAPPPAQDCTPRCTWTCEKKECDQVCAPKCNQAVCSTRCKGFNLDSCRMKCGPPQCRVVCPKHNCPKGNCAACKTECGKPMCQMECKKDEQDCRHICAQPICNWACRKPDVCPKPQCSMTCDKPKQCMDNTRIVQALPPLQAGETEVLTTLSAPHSAAPSPAAAAAASPAAAASSLLSSNSSVAHGRSSQMRVDLATMGADSKIQKRQVELTLTTVDTAAAALVSWAREVRRVNGKLTTIEASCSSGDFRCSGDAAWCNQQKSATNCAGIVAAESEATIEAAEDALEDREMMQVVGPARSADLAFLQQRHGKHSSLQA